MGVVAWKCATLLHKFPDPYFHQRQLQPSTLQTWRNDLGAALGVDM